ncbi:MAG: DUF494 family protein [Bdellovibrionales bacterium]|nr:DUF494 family protein [Bdellovibrionales bacterium]
MNPKVMDAVGLIGKFVSENWESIVNHEEILDELQNQGFSSREITDAFRWIERNTLGPDEPLKDTFSIQPPVRALSPIESAKLTPEAYGVLLRCYERGLIDSLILEDILERIVRSEAEEVGIKEVRRLTALTLFTRVQSEWRDYLHSTNTLIH